MAQASKLADALANKLDSDAQAYGGLLRAEVLLAQKNVRAALDAVRESQKHADTWLGRLILARVYHQNWAPLPKPASEIDVLQKRRGEAMAVFLDDVPSYRVFAPVLYWQGRTREGLKSPGAKESYIAFF